jgi:hypothetical protein
VEIIPYGKVSLKIQQTCITFGKVVIMLPAIYGDSANFKLSARNKQNKAIELLNIFRTMTILDNIKATFSFLELDFGFELIGIEEPKNYKAKYLVIYRNDKSKLQIEICADETWFHCEIRRIVNGQPAKYSDNENCVSYQALAILESNNNYDDSDYSIGYSGGNKGLTKVLGNTAKLFQRNIGFFTTDRWLDTKRLEQLNDDEFQNKFGFKPSDNKNKSTYFGELKKEATKFLKEKSYELILDSIELSPFDYDGMTEKIVFYNGHKEIKLTAQDWRDNYFLYDIQVNDKKVFTLDITEHKVINEAVQLTMEKLKKCI